MKAIARFRGSLPTNFKENFFWIIAIPIFGFVLAVSGILLHHFHLISMTMKVLMKLSSIGIYAGHAIWIFRMRIANEQEKETCGEKDS